MDIEELELYCPEKLQIENNDEIASKTDEKILAISYGEKEKEIIVVYEHGQISVITGSSKCTSSININETLSCFAFTRASHPRMGAFVTQSGMVAVWDFSRMEIVSMNKRDVHMGAQCISWNSSGSAFAAVLNNGECFSFTVEAKLQRQEFSPKKNDIPDEIAHQIEPVIDWIGRKNMLAIAYGHHILLDGKKVSVANENGSEGVIHGVACSESGLIAVLLSGGTIRVLDRAGSIFFESSAKSFRGLLLSFVPKSDILIVAHNCISAIDLSRVTISVVEVCLMSFHIDTAISFLQSFVEILHFSP